MGRRTVDDHAAWRLNALRAAGSGVAAAGAGAGAGFSRAETTYATTTDTMTSGTTVMPSVPRNSVVSSTAVSGKPSSTAHIAPMPIAAPATAGSPGRWDSAMPPAAPMNIDGKIGPPRKVASATEYARPLQATSRTSAPAEYVPLCVSSGPSAF